MGYTEIIVYLCHTDFVMVTKTFQITQTPADCSAGLTDAGFIPSEIPYNSAGSEIVVTADYTTVFIHPSLTDCPLQYCALYDAAC